VRVEIAVAAKSRMKSNWHVGLFAIAMLFLPCKSWAQGCNPMNSSPAQSPNSAGQGGSFSVNVVMPSQVPGPTVTSIVSLDDANWNHRIRLSAYGSFTTYTQVTTTNAMKLVYQGYWTHAATGQTTTGNQYTYGPSYQSGPDNWPANFFAPGDRYVGVWTAYDANGNFSTDRTIWDFSNSPANTVDMQDTVATNIYLAVTSTFAGTPVFNIADCQQMHQSGVFHTGHAQVQATNVASNEVQPQLDIAGQTLAVTQANNGQTPVNVSATTYISAIYGDDITVGYGGYLYCSAAGPIWQDFFTLRFEIALMTSTRKGPNIKNADGSVNIPVKDACLITQPPQDWQNLAQIHVGVAFVSLFGNHDNWQSMGLLWRFPDQAGNQWHALSNTTGFLKYLDRDSILSELVTLLEGISSPYYGAIPAGCTNFDHNLYVIWTHQFSAADPWPWPPNKN